MIYSELSLSATTPKAFTDSTLKPNCRTEDKGDDLFTQGLGHSWLDHVGLKEPLLITVFPYGSDTPAPGFLNSSENPGLWLTLPLSVLSFSFLLNNMRAFEKKSIYLTPFLKFFNYYLLA